MVTQAFVRLPRHETAERAPLKCLAAAARPGIETLTQNLA